MVEVYRVFIEFLDSLWVRVTHLLFLPISGLYFLFLVVVVLLRGVTVGTETAVPGSVVTVMGPLGSGRSLLSFFNFIL